MVTWKKQINYFSFRLYLYEESKLLFIINYIPIYSEQQLSTLLATITNAHCYCLQKRALTNNKYKQLTFITILKSKLQKSMKLKIHSDLTAEQFNQQLISQEASLTRALKMEDEILSNLEKYLSKITALYQEEVEQITKLAEKQEKSQEELVKLEQLILTQNQQHVDLVKKYEEQSQQSQRITSNLKIQLDQFKREEYRKLHQVESAQKQINQVMNQTKIVENKLDAINEQNKKLQKHIYQNQVQVKMIGEYVEDCFLIKKKLNNQLQEMRGNIRVYCRIRPFVNGENQESIYELVNQNTLKINVPKENQKSENHLKDYHFNFQQIFGVADTQQRVFNQLSQLIQSAVDGKNVCIFAYGQTGSGKTFTMQGGAGYKNAGIIPRSVQLIFDEIKRAEKYQWHAEVSLIIQEVYLQNVEDLLNSNNKNAEESPTKFIVQSPQQTYSVLEQATKNRKVAETSCNQHSSRSHLVFRININLKNANNRLQQRNGSLNLVDLAGSERVSQSKVEGERMKQTNAINKSLSNLGQVITALAKKDPHIPYRNSKLTYLLQKYLQGDSKTLMFVNISPKQADFNQTLCSLRFAEKVKQCKLKK